MADNQNKAQVPGVQVRVAAARVLLNVLEDYKPLHETLEQVTDEIPTQDRALLQALCYGVMRWHLQLESWMEQLAKRPANKIKPNVRVLIELGLFQLQYMRIPAHAAIHTTVEGAGKFQASRAKGFINAVLRAFMRQQAELVSCTSDACVYAHPEWMLEQFKNDWPDDWQNLAEENNQQAPMTLRVDTSNISIDEYLKQLNGVGIDAQAHPDVDTAIVLQRAVDVAELPGFAQGVVSVQDAAAQLAVHFLQAQSSDRVLDACAAPGGKTAHILQSVKPEFLTAMDNNGARLKRVNEMFERIRLKAELIEGDAADPSAWWDGQLYDSILLDAPCSASGVIRRHPDIKHLRSAKALQKAVKRQARILDALWPLLKPGGRMLYATCSVFKDENENQIARFLERHEDAQCKALPSGYGRQNIGVQLLPGEQQMDGFYFAALEKTC